LGQAAKLKELGGRKSTVLATNPNCQWKIPETKHLPFAGRELRFLKLLAGRRVFRLNNLGDLKDHSTEFWDSQPQCLHESLLPEADRERERERGRERERSSDGGKSEGSW
jgi:hypothetical protein